MKAIKVSTISVDDKSKKAFIIKETNPYYEWYKKSSFHKVWKEFDAK
jgi:hypothetical protein